MIKFFRKIRQGLLKENKFSKYLLYAIGEIVLVVIGILIALQLNNLNEQGKIKNQEREILAELVNNLDENIATLEDYKNMQSERVHRADSILNHFKNNTATDSLSNIFPSITYNDKLNLSFSTFETIKTIGFDLIKNKQIRLGIIELYETIYPNLMKDTEDMGVISMQLYLDWSYKNGQYRERIFNSTLYRNDDNYYFIDNYIKSRKAWKTAMVRSSTTRLEKTKELKQLIENYLEESD